MDDQTVVVPFHTHVALFQALVSRPFPQLAPLPPSPFLRHLSPPGSLFSPLLRRQSFCVVVSFQSRFPCPFTNFMIRTLLPCPCTHTHSLSFVGLFSSIFSFAGNFFPQPSLFAPISIFLFTYPKKIAHSSTYFLCAFNTPHLFHLLSFAPVKYVHPSVHHIDTPSLFSPSYFVGRLLFFFSNNYGLFSPYLSSPPFASSHHGPLLGIFSLSWACSLLPCQ